MASLGQGGAYVTAARAAGYEYNSLILRIVDVAPRRYFGCRRRRPGATASPHRVTFHPEKAGSASRGRFLTLDRTCGMLASMRPNAPRRTAIKSIFLGLVFVGFAVPGDRSGIGRDIERMRPGPTSPEEAVAIAVNSLIASREATAWNTRAIRSPSPGTAIPTHPSGEALGGTGGSHDPSRSSTTPAPPLASSLEVEPSSADPLHVSTIEACSRSDTPAVTTMSSSLHSLPPGAASPGLIWSSPEPWTATEPRGERSRMGLANRGGRGQHGAGSGFRRRGE